MIAIIDYGVGNLFSLRSSLTHLGLEAVVTADAQTIRKADRLILPGVGAFGDAMDKLSATGLVPVIREQAAQKPLLGICLGMQLLFEKSYEYGEHGGLGFVKGEVCPLEPDLKDKTLKVPQIGWNALHIVRDDPLFRYIREGEYVYYVHSYYGKNCTGSTLAVSDYSIPVTGVVRAGRVYGTQFHPEKSGETGLNIPAHAGILWDNLPEMPVPVSRKFSFPMQGLQRSGPYHHNSLSLHVGRHQSIPHMQYICPGLPLHNLPALQYLP